jgi:hypothetical protein
MLATTAEPNVRAGLMLNPETGAKTNTYPVMSRPMSQVVEYAKRLLFELTRTTVSRKCSRWSAYAWNGNHIVDLWRMNDRAKRKSSKCDAKGRP